MKRNLLFILVALLPLVANAEDAQELTVSDIEFIDEGYNDDPPMIILTKEGSALNVHLMNYSAHPDTEEFVITPKMSGGGDGEPCSVSIGVSYINHSETEVITTFNVSFNVHGIEANSFFFTCWWYDGMVNLTDCEPLELWEEKEISIDEVIYTLDNKTKTAALSDGRYVKGAFNIPSELDYEGQTFTLTSIEYPGFANNTSLTSVTIPKGVTSIRRSVFYRCTALTDVYCYAENVPNTGSSAFYECPIASATLHVPAGSVDKYKAASPWSEFGSIVALSDESHQPLPFLEGNPIWVYKFERLNRATGWKNGVRYGCFIDTGDRHFTYYFLGKQKEIDGKVYTMVGEITSRGEDELTVNRWLPVREENGIVYAITDSLPGLIEYDFNENEIPYQQLGNECVLYNFNKKIGETIYPQNKELRVESYGTYQLMDGTVCRVLKTIDEDFYLYEKLGYLHGSPYGIMGPPYEFVYPTGGDVYTTRLNDYFVDNVMLYKAPDVQEGLCVNDTCWSRDDAEAYVPSYRADPRQEEVFSYIRCLQTATTGDVTIDGLNYYLYSTSHEATLKGGTWTGELDIPAEVSYNGQAYTVKDIVYSAFRNCKDLTKVRIPKTIEKVLNYYPTDDEINGMVSPDHMNPFMGCTALESIEVDEENPSLKSVDGVLFSQDGKGYYYYLTNSYYGTGLYCYPAGAQRESYTIPDGVEWIGSGAFEHNQYISTLTIPSSMKMIYYSVFSGCSNLKNVYCYAEDVPIAFSEAFKGFPIASATLHVPAGSLEKYKATSPWNEFGNIVAIEGIAQEYFPEGTRWTEIRLDTLKYDYWYSKVGDEWIPNFETIEYYVQGEYTDKNAWYGWNGPYKCVYTNGPGWSDLLTLMIYHDKEYNIIYATSAEFFNNALAFLPGVAYGFNEWNVGTTLYYKDLMEANSTTFPPNMGEYGTIEEIKEGYFGGVRPLKYVDLNGVRIIHGIGVTMWNSDECLFGPIDPDFFFHYNGETNYNSRSMLVHFERNGEVLYDVWPEKEAAAPVTFTKNQMATIILPTVPDAEKGKYYRLDRREEGKIIFEQEKQPQARTPYIIIPNEDFSIAPGTLDLAGLSPDTVSIGGIDFIGSYSREEPVCREGWYIDIIDTTPDCQVEEGKAYTIGALRAYLTVNWDDPINHEGTKGPGEKIEVVLRDYGTNIASPIRETGEGAAIYDLSGRKILGTPARGIYLMKGKLTVIK